MDRPKHGTARESGSGWIIVAAAIVALVVAAYVLGAFPH